MSVSCVENNKLQQLSIELKQGDRKEWLVSVAATAILAIGIIGSIAAECITAGCLADIVKTWSGGAEMALVFGLTSMSVAGLVATVALSWKLDKIFDAEEWSRRRPELLQEIERLRNEFSSVELYSCPIGLKTGE